MKFRVTFKDPDTLHVSVRDVVKDQINSIAGRLDDEEKEPLIDRRVESEMEKLKKFVRYSEYITIEFDTDANTAIVVPSL